MGKKRINVPTLPFDVAYFDFGRSIPMFDQAIRHRATPVKVTPHVICPCVVPTKQGGTGEAIPDCPSCGGTALAYIDEKSIDTLLYVTNVDSTDNHLEEGTISTGKINILAPSDITLAEGDRLHLYENLISVRYSRKYSEKLKGMKLPFDVQEVKILTINEPNTLEIKVLKENTDFSLSNKNRYLTFPKDGKVKDSAVVSGVFLIAPYYVIDSLPAAFRGQRTRAFSPTGDFEWKKMPQRATAVRYDLAFGRFHKEVTQNGSIEEGQGA